MLKDFGVFHSEKYSRFFKIVFGGRTLMFINWGLPRPCYSLFWNKFGSQTVPLHGVLLILGKYILYECVCVCEKIETYKSMTDVRNCRKVITICQYGKINISLVSISETTPGLYI